MPIDKDKPRKRVHDIPLTPQDNTYKLCVIIPCSDCKRRRRLKLSSKELLPKEISIQKPSEEQVKSFPFNWNSLIIEKVGSIYGKYKELEELGSGSCGVVKKVIHKVSGKIYALKVMRKSSNL